MIIGLTGGIGSGKSAAAEIFIELGIDVIDADFEARNALKKSSNGYNLFIKQFGSKFLDSSNNIDRQLLRKEIFSNELNKEILEQIIHPIVQSKILDFVSNKKSPYCIVMVPLLFETNSYDSYDRILLIDCDIETQIIRSSNRDKQTPNEIKKIITKQASREQRLSIADDIILNTSSLTSLHIEILKIHNKYLEIVKND